MPGVQNPHCSPWHSAKPCWTGSSSPLALQPLHREHPVPVGHGGEHRAGLHRGLVQPDHARAAVRGVAAPVRAGEAQLVAQEVDQQQPRLDLAGVVDAVDGDGDLHVRRWAPAAVPRPPGGPAQRPVGQLARPDAACSRPGRAGPRPGGSARPRSRRPGRSSPRWRARRAGTPRPRPRRSAARPPRSGRSRRRRSPSPSSQTAAPAAPTGQSPTRRPTFS